MYLFRKSASTLNRASGFEEGYSEQRYFCRSNRRVRSVSTCIGYTLSCTVSTCNKTLYLGLAEIKSAPVTVPDATIYVVYYCISAMFKQRTPTHRNTAPASKLTKKSWSVSQVTRARRSINRRALNPIPRHMEKKKKKIPHTRVAPTYTVRIRNTTWKQPHHHMYPVPIRIIVYPSPYSGKGCLARPRCHRSHCI